MSKRILALCFAVVISTASVAAAGNAGTGFPGIGSKVAWNKASRLFNTGNHVRSSGDTEGAIRLYKEAIRIYPFDADFHLNLALTLSKFRRDQKAAEKSIKRAIELAPDDFGYRWQYGVILLKQNELDRAKTAFVSARPLKKTPEEEKQLSEILHKLDHRNKN